MTTKAEQELCGSNCERSIKLGRADREEIRDMISDLPDPLLLHILFFLRMDEVITTSSLAKRWRYLWRSVDNMDFLTRRSEFDRDVVELVDKTLALHNGLKVKRFRAWFYYKESHAPRVDSWIHFAVAHDIEKLDLDFVRAENPLHSYTCLPYSLPPCLFECRSLMELILNCCDLNLPTSFCFISLKRLVLMNVELLGDTVKILTSSCPVLEELVLENCNQTCDLNISVLSQRLRRIKVVESPYANEESKVEIYAPHLLHLELQSGMPMPYHVRSLPSLITASIELKQDDVYLDHDDYFCNRYGYPLARLVAGLHKVKALQLSSWCVQVLLKDGDVLDSLPALGNLKHLKLEVELDKYKLPGVACLLRSSPNLETLTIHLCQRPTLDWGNMDCPKYSDRFNFSEGRHWETQVLPLTCLKYHLKTVTLERFEGKDNEVELIKFLLKNSIVLKEIIIMVPAKYFTGSGQAYLEYCKESRFSGNYLENLKELLLCARTSPDAEILFCGGFSTYSF